MIEAAIVTPWAGIYAGGTGSNRPAVADDYPIDKWTDITGQPCENIAPTPNEYTILATLKPDVFDTLEKDNKYEILWSEEVVDNG